MTRDDSPDRVAELIRQAQAARAWTAEMRERMVATARQVAATEDQVAGTLDRLAEERPHRAVRLATLSANARRNAVHVLQWAEDHTPGLPAARRLL
jgi:hypothetical protein